MRFSCQIEWNEDKNTKNSQKCSEINSQKCSAIDSQKKSQHSQYVFTAAPSSWKTSESCGIRQENVAEPTLLSLFNNCLKLQTSTTTSPTSASIYPHPDLMALICLVNFYPFCHNGLVTFPAPITPRLAEVLQEAPLSVRLAKGQIDRNLARYPSKKTDKIHMLAFGGGWDSVALTCLLKDHTRKLVLVHQLEQGVTSQIPSLGQQLAETPGTKQPAIEFRLVHSNSRSLVLPPGYATWPAVLTACLLLACEYNVDHLLLGGNLGSTFLNSGRGYHPTHKRPNQWYRLFAAAGLPLVMPLAGVSDLGVYRIIQQADTSLLDRAIYCQRVAGSNCHRCWKCFRRQAIRSAAESTSRSTSSTSSASNNSPLHQFRSYQLRTFFELWKTRFQDAKQYTKTSGLSSIPLIGRFLLPPRSPSGDFGPSLLWALSNLPELEMEWTGPRRQLPWPQLNKSQLAKLDQWLSRYYPPSLQLIHSKELREMFQHLLEKYLEPMSPAHQKLLEKF